MGSIIQIGEALEFAAWYLKESWAEWAWDHRTSGVAVREFNLWVASEGNDRMGQAFMNSLTMTDYERITETLYDPFYGGAKEVMAAIEFLTRKEGESNVPARV